MSPAEQSETRPHAVCGPDGEPVRWVRPSTARTRTRSQDDEVATTSLPDDIDSRTWFLVQTDGTVVEIPDGAAVVRRDGWRGFAITLFRTDYHDVALPLFIVSETPARDLSEGC